MKLFPIKKLIFSGARSCTALLLISLLCQSKVFGISISENTSAHKLIITPPAISNPARKVLVIYSYHDTLPWQAKIRDALFARLEATPPAQRPELFEERFEAHRLSIITSNEDFLKLLEEKYRNVKLDLIIAENDFAYLFLKKYPQVFPNVPRQFITYTAGENDQVLSIVGDVLPAIDTILKVLPNTQRIVAILERTPLNKAEQISLESLVKPLATQNKQLEIWSHFSFAELYQRVAKLSASTVIFYVPVTTDRFGKHRIPRDVLIDLHKISPVPIFTYYDSFIGVGAVGGYLISASKIGNLIAQAVLGLPLPKTRAEIDAATKGYYFDDVELKRWHIQDKNLPPNSIIINRNKSDWYKYRWQIAATFVAFVFESLLIIALLRSLRWRKEATKALAQQRDLLDQRVIERTQELEISRNLAQSANRAKSDFLANMSHEIRTPINAIMGMTHLTLHTELTAKQRNYVNKIDFAAHSLLSIVNDILDFSKIEAGKLELEQINFSLAEVLNYLADVIDIKAKEKSIVITSLVNSETPKWLIGDSLRLSQILINLVSNAVKFTERGRIIISVTPEEFYAENVCLRFSVQDSGIGMSPEQVAELFQSFSQADTSTTRKYGGTGLGLVISKQLVELMGGQIWAVSELGKGSTFSFTVILGISQQPVLTTKPVEKAAPVNLTGRRVLLVEDNPINRELAFELLTELGVDVEMAENGKQGLARVLAEQFDLVFMDIQMPEMDGLTATRLIREHERLRDLPIIAMTAHAMSGDREKSLAAGMNEHLTKPIDPQKLTAALSRWIKPHLVQNQPSTTFSSKQKPNTEAVDSFSNLSAFDIPAALLRINGNAQLLRKLISMFLHNYAQFMPQLQQLMGEGNIESARHLVHGIKGVAGNLEIKALYPAAKALEQALLEQNMANVAELIATLESALNVALVEAAALEKTDLPNS